MASYHWVAEKAIPFLKKDANMGAKKLQKELDEKYNVTIGYGTVWSGRQIAAEKIFGTWEESFALLFNFKAEVELKMPGSVVEIHVINKDDGVYFYKFFCCFKPSIDGFLNGCRPYLSIDSTAPNGRWDGHMPSAVALDGHHIFIVGFLLFIAIISFLTPSNPICSFSNPCINSGTAFHQKVLPSKFLPPGDKLHELGTCILN